MIEPEPGTEGGKFESKTLGIKARDLALLALILLAAALVRLWRLGSLPPGIFRDEAEKALNGWFLLNGGVDASGRPWPVFIEVFGVTTSAIYQYATLPFLGAGGLNEWTVRLPAAMVGVVTVAFTWLFCRQVWGGRVAAWAAGLLAISPWHVPLSRWAQQGVFLPLLFVIAAWAVAKFFDGMRKEIQRGIKDEHEHEERGNGGGTAWLMLAGASMALAMYAYDPARLFAPLLGLSAAVVWWRVWVRRWKAVLSAAAVFLVVVSPVIWLLATQSEAAQARFRFLSVFQPATSPGEGIAAFAANYLKHFSPGFLLISGDEEIRHSGGVGMLNFAELALALAGSVVVIRRRCRWGVFVILWILLSPVAASLTRVGVPHALRAQVALPAWQVLAAVGVAGAVERISSPRQKLLQQVALLAVLVGALPFFVTYYGNYATKSAANWQYGVKQALQFTSAPHTKASQVFFKFITGAEYIVPFYAKMNRGEYLRMQRGMGRYHIVPYGQPDMLLQQSVPWLDVKGPAVLVTLPGLEHVEGWQPIPISAPGDEQMPPVMLMYVNDQLMHRIKE